jgi:low affinity Fe/Cu permease
MKLRSEFRKANLHSSLAAASRDFRVFWIGLFISGMTNQFTTVAMAWQIYG